MSPDVAQGGSMADLYEKLAAADREIARLREALADIETATNYSPHRAAGTWDENLAKLIHAHARLLPGALAESATTGEEPGNG